MFRPSVVVPEARLRRDWRGLRPLAFAPCTVSQGRQVMLGAGRIRGRGPLNCAARQHPVGIQLIEAA